MKLSSEAELAAAFAVINDPKFNALCIRTSPQDLEKLGLYPDLQSEIKPEAPPSEGDRGDAKLVGDMERS